MKQLLAVTGVVLIVFLLAMNALVPASRDASAASVQPSAAPRHSYYICAVDDRVAVYRDGELYRSTDTLLSSLPKADQTRLKKGIYLDSDEELRRLLQDYCS